MADADVAALRAEYEAACARERWGEAAAVAVLLSFEPVAGRREFARYVTRSGVNWAEALRDRTWSAGERLLIATAAALWTGRAQHAADISRVPYLDDEFNEVWLAMVTASRTGKVPDDGG
jgi:hypothetical protein